MGRFKVDFQETGQVLRRFGQGAKDSRRGYTDFCADGLGAEISLDDLVRKDNITSLPLPRHALKCMAHRIILSCLS